MTLEMTPEPIPLRPIKIFISTGEVSGDLQGALLINALKRRARDVGLELDIVALGGASMAQAGATLLNDTSGIGSIGILEALPHVLPTFKVQQQTQSYLQTCTPDLVILIDYMQPNLVLGRYLKQHLPAVPTVYYIAPQEWVWSSTVRNTRQIVEYTDLLLAIFPEEARYFQTHGGTVHWVGHPLIDRVQSFPSRNQAREALKIPQEQVAIALFPASRSQELKYVLPVVFEAAQQLQAERPHIHFWIPLSLAKFRDAIEQAIHHYGLQATVVEDQTQAVIAAADLAITKSGTVNLELALMDVPQVVVYRFNPITAWIAKHIVKFSIPFASPPNLVMMKPIVPEFLQADATVENLTTAALSLLDDDAQRQKTLADYAEMRKRLGDIGVCDRAAQAILGLLPQTSLASRSIQSA